MATATLPSIAFPPPFSALSCRPCCSSHHSSAPALSCSFQGAWWQPGPALSWGRTDAHIIRKVFASAKIPEIPTKRRRRKPITDKSTERIDDNSQNTTDSAEVNNSLVSEGAAVVRPRKRRGRPRKGTEVEEAANSEVIEGQTNVEEYETDFFEELETEMARDKTIGFTNDIGEETGANGRSRMRDAGGAVTMEQQIDNKIDDKLSGEAVSSNVLNGSVQWGEGLRPGGNDEDVVRGQDWISDRDTEIPSPDMASAAVQSGGNRDLNEVNEGLEEEEDDYPLWVEEDDPTWPEEGEEGWGFRTSQFFEELKIKTVKTKSTDNDDSDDEDDELALNWENEAEDWMIKEITSVEWEATVFAEPSPLVLYVFARYGRRGMDGWNMLKELEAAVLTIWESRKAPLRAVKVDVGMEVDLGSALEIHQDKCPQLIFIKNGKALYKLEGFRTAEELVQIMAHFFYNGTRPSCLDKTQAAKSLSTLV